MADHLATDEVSLGDFVLTGGEPAALCVIDAVVRLLPGALGDHESASGDSHYDGLLSPPSYTRPPEYRGHAVPEVLRSGNHAKIAAWRQERGGTPDPRTAAGPLAGAPRVGATSGAHAERDPLGPHSGEDDGTVWLTLAREGLRTDLPAFDAGRYRPGHGARARGRQGAAAGVRGRRASPGGAAGSARTSPSGRSRPASASSASSRSTARRSRRSTWSGAAGCAAPSSTTSAR